MVDSFRNALVSVMGESALRSVLPIALTLSHRCMNELSRRRIGFCRLVRRPLLYPSVPLSLLCGRLGCFVTCILSYV